MNSQAQNIIGIDTLLVGIHVEIGQFDLCTFTI